MPISRGVLARLVLCALVAVGSGMRCGATEPDPLEAAISVLQSGDAASASARLRSIVNQKPSSARAWRALATAHRQLEQYPRAIDAWRRVLRIEPGSVQAMYGLGICYAGISDWANAFLWLGEARQSRRYDMTQLTQEKELATMRTDPRYLALLPREEEFEHAFVEPVTVIHEWRGESANDQFGWIARDIGDVDGDGVHDMVTSAPTSGAGGRDAGRVYVYSGKSGKRLWVVDGSAGDQLGSGLEQAGDTNGDGIPDVVASGPGNGVGFIYSGKDGRVLQRWVGPDTTETFGNHISGVGDVDRDGCADVLVGAPGTDPQGKGSGHAYLYSGKDGHLLRAFAGERAGDAFGSTVGGRSHQQPLLIIGAPRAGNARHGRVYVFEGMADKPSFTMDADSTGNALGYMFVSVIGDIDGDGRADVYASDWSNRALGPGTGRAYVNSGRTGQRLLTLTGESAGDGFGIGTAVAGDVDGDGRDDLIVGAWQFSGTAVATGRAYLYSGADGKLLSTFTSKVPGDTFGFDAVGLGDVDGDGTIDLLISAAWSGVNGYHSGRLWVISSGVNRLPRHGAGR
jgi:hypothetical protein